MRGSVLGLASVPGDLADPLPRVARHADEFGLPDARTEGSDDGGVQFGPRLLSLGHRYRMGVQGGLYSWNVWHYRGPLDVISGFLGQYGAVFFRLGVFLPQVPPDLLTDNIRPPMFAGGVLSAPPGQVSGDADIEQGAITVVEPVDGGTFGHWSSPRRGPGRCGE